MTDVGLVTKLLADYREGDESVITSYSIHYTKLYDALEHDVDEAGKTVPPGTQGELLTRGYSVMQGYWGEAEKTAQSIDADGS